MLDFDRATFIPTGQLSLLPLHAVASDELTVTYTPSVRALQAALAAAEEERAGPPVLLGIGNPLPNPQPLPFAQSEIEAVASLFAPDSYRVLNERQSTRAATLVELPGATHVPFACHGSLDVAELPDSALYLAGCDPPRVRRLCGWDWLTAAQDALPAPEEKAA